MVTQNSVPGSSFGKGCAPATQSKLKLIRPGSGRAEPCRRISVLAGMPEQKSASLLSVGFTKTDGHTKVFQDPALRQVVPRLLKAGIDTDRVQAAGFVLILEKCLALIGRAKPPKIKNNLQTGSVANQALHFLVFAPNIEDVLAIFCFFCQNLRMSLRFFVFWAIGDVLKISLFSGQTLGMSLMFFGFFESKT